jgi:hypothetical protein
MTAVMVSQGHEGNQHMRKDLPPQLRDLVAVEQAVEDRVGFILFTVLAFSPDRTRMTRIHSSRPAEYPVGGTKDLTIDVSRAWLERCVLRQEVFYGPSKADLREVFADSDQIEQLGCGSVLNVPVIAGGASIAALNILGAENGYTVSDIREAGVIAARSVHVVTAAIEKFS